MITLEQKLKDLASLLDTPKAPQHDEFLQTMAYKLEKAESGNVTRLSRIQMQQLDSIHDQHFR